MQLADISLAKPSTHLMLFLTDIRNRLIPGTDYRCKNLTTASLLWLGGNQNPAHFIKSSLVVGAGAFCNFGESPTDMFRSAMMKPYILHSVLSFICT